MIDSLSDLKEFMSVHYFIHIATILLYWPIRSYVLLEHENAKTMFRQGSGSMTDQWLTQEQEYFAVAFAIFFFKCRKAATLRQVVEKALVFGKLFAIVVLIKMQVLWVGGAYCFLCAMVSTLVSTPSFSGPEDIEDLTKTSFDRRVRSPQSAEDKKTVWLVIFGADWATKCGALSPLFAKLSVSGKLDERRKWGRVDLAQFPELAVEFSIEANDPWKAKQLPTVIMFYGGKELRRLPVVGPSGSVLDCNFGEQEVRRYFQLDQTTEQFRAARKKEAAKQRKD